MSCVGTAAAWTRLDLGGPTLAVPPWWEPRADRAELGGPVVALGSTRPPGIVCTVFRTPADGADAADDDDVLGVERGLGVEVPRSDVVDRAPVTLAGRPARWLMVDHPTRDGGCATTQVWIAAAGADVWVLAVTHGVLDLPGLGPTIDAVVGSLTWEGDRCPA